MRARTISILILSLVIAVAVVTQWIGERRSPPEPTSRPEPITASPDVSQEPLIDLPVAEPAGSVAGSSREPERTTPDEELDGALWIEGSVVIPAGTPADERVEVLAIGEDFEARPPHRVAIQADGSFRVAFAPGTGRGTLRLDAKYLYLPAEVTVSPSGRETATVLSPRLGGCIRGKVVVPPGAEDLARLLVGHAVEVSGISRTRPRSGEADPRLPRLDANLAFEAHAVRAGPSWVDVRLPGAATRDNTKVEVEAGRIHDVVIELLRTGSIAGTVVDPAGLPIGGAIVLTRRHQPGVGARTDPDGRFLLENLIPGELRLDVKADGRVQIDPPACVVAPGEAIEGLRVVLHRAARITGRVLGPDGTARRGAHVYLERKDVPAPARTAVPERFTTNVQGRFSFRDLVPGTYGVVATDGKLRFVPETTEGSARRGIVLDEGTAVDDVELRLPAVGRVTGLVTGPDGTGVLAAYVFARGKDWDVNEFEWVPYTDADGRFSLDDLPPGEVTIRAVSRSLVSSTETRTVVRAGETVDVRIALVQGTRLRFTDTSQPMLFPITFVAIDQARHEWKLYSGGTWQSDDMDDAPYGPLPPGRYDIVATTSNGMRWRGKADLRGEDEVIVTMQPGP